MVRIQSEQGRVTTNDLARMTGALTFNTDDNVADVVAFSLRGVHYTATIEAGRL